MKKNIIAKKIHINGIVQGVGFRPFVFQLAHQYGLFGDVLNTSSGVTVRIEGGAERVECFCRDISGKKPPLAQITDLRLSDEDARGLKEFSILKSGTGSPPETLISPDVSICDDCIADIKDPENRRYRYPFTNCTNCGPRYTIIDDIPYDRPNTSMKHFTMCEECNAEYKNPLDRRFHAQPNGCEKCGPRLSLFTGEGQPVSTKDPISRTASLLKEGRIVAIKGLGGFHLAVDASNRDAVKLLRKLKRREEKPLAMMARDLDTVRKFAGVTADEEKLLTSRERPIVLLKKKKHPEFCPAEEVAEGNRYLGVMLPYTPLHILLMEEGPQLLVMTSGNRSGDPISIDNHEAFKAFSHIADYFLVNNRDIYLRSDDSIVRHCAENIRFIRRSRGYAPVPIFIGKECPGILACGSLLKSTVCLTKGDKAFLSQHIGDLENISTYDFFKLTIRHLKRILSIEPRIIAHDMHPEYMSSLYAKELKGVRLIPVQHHHAHIVSCMAENRISGTVMGIALDGTGYGSDGRIWGGEIMIARAGGFTRAAHLSYTPMPGSNAAVREPWRMGIGHLYKTFGNGFMDLDLPIIRNRSRNDLKFIACMIEKKINSPLTSSMGRLFDAVSAIIGVREEISFEGQAAMDLEMMAESSSDDFYRYGIPAGNLVDRPIPTEPLIRGVVGDFINGVPTGIISDRFHNTVIQMFSDLCAEIKKHSGLDRVVLSGGVFQNSILLEGFERALTDRGLKTFTHSKVPSNDGGLSLGQALVAASVTGQETA